MRKRLRPEMKTEMASTGATFRQVVSTPTLRALAGAFLVGGLCGFVLHVAIAPRQVGRDPMLDRALANIHAQNEQLLGQLACVQPGTHPGGAPGR